MPEKKSSSKTTTRKKDNRGGRRPGAGNPALTGKAFDQEEGRNRKYILSAMSLWDLPAIDLKDEEQIAERTDTYFAMMAEQDMKPTVVGYAMALGLDRRQLWALVVNDQPFGNRFQYDLPSQCHDIIKNGYRTMEFLWENYMQNRQIETVSGIFLGKNHYGYKDQQETVVVTPNLLGDGADQKQLEQRYLDSVVVEED